MIFANINLSTVCFFVSFLHCYRAKIYLDFTLPSRDEVFENYLVARKWKSYKNKLCRNSDKLRPRTNWTKVEDVPIMCRLNESL